MDGDECVMAVVISELFHVLFLYALYCILYSSSLLPVLLVIVELVILQVSLLLSSRS